MPLSPNYYYIQLDSWTATINPTRYQYPKATKSIAKVKTLTKTISQHWDIVDSDKQIYMEWDWLDKTDVDSIQALYEVASEYTFVDIKNESWTVVIEDFTADMNGTLDSDGFTAKLTLQVVSKP